MSIADNLKQFFTDIWGEEENTIFLAAKPSPDSFKVTRPIVVPKELETVVAFIIKNSTSQDTYFTPGTFKPDAPNKEKGNGLRAKALWVDIDGYHDTQGTVEAALELLKEIGLPEPSYRIQSSLPGAEHWYWLLDDYADAKLINHVNQRIAYYLKGDKACWDISHVLRPPYTHNYKEDYDKPEVKVVRYDPKRLDIGLFKVLPKVKAALDFIEKPENLLTWQECEKMYPWSAAIWKLTELEKKDFKDYGGKAARGAAMVKLGYELAEVGASDDVIFSMLYHVDDKWEKFKNRPDRDKYIKDIVLRVRIKYPAMSFTQPPREEKQLEPFQDQDIQTMWGWDDFLNSEFEYSWLIENLIPDNSINFVSSRPGIGKSRYTLQMATSLGMGTDFLGYPIVGGQKKVVFFSLEMGPPVLKYFVEGVTESLGDGYDKAVMNENVILLPMGTPLDLESPEGQQFFRYVMDEVNPDVVFIDALGSLTTDDLNEKASKTISNKMKEWLISYGCTFFVVHHNRKELQASPNKPPTLSDFYGNTMASTDAATIISLWKSPKDEENDVQMHIVKGRTVKGDDKKVWLLDGSQMIFSKKGEIDNDGESIGDYAAFKPSASTEQFGLGFLD